MSDLISRSALMEDTEKRFGHPNAFYSNSSFKELIDEQPTIEAVPVVERNDFENVVKRLNEEMSLLEEEIQEAREYDDEQIVFAINNQLRAFKYALRVIGEETR